METQILDFFAKWIEKEAGIVYAEFNRFQLKTRLEEIAKFYGLENISQLHEKALKGMDANFKQLLTDVATNNETSFFRDPKMFSVLEKLVFPQILSQKTDNKELRIWSAASSFGQESYSIAMILKDRHLLPAGWSAKILATDICERALERVKSAKYSQLEIQRGLPPALLVKYFSKDEQNFWIANNELRSLVDVKKQNLLSPMDHHGKFDLILCRNVLIYQNVENKVKIIDRLHKQLRPNGYLVLGAGESLLGLSGQFEQVSSDGVIIYKNKSNVLEKAA